MYEELKIEMFFYYYSAPAAAEDGEESGREATIRVTKTMQWQKIQNENDELSLFYLARHQYH